MGAKQPFQFRPLRNGRQFRPQFAIEELPGALERRFEARFVAAVLRDTQMVELMLQNERHEPAEQNVPDREIAFPPDHRRRQDDQIAGVPGANGLQESGGRFRGLGAFEDIGGLARQVAGAGAGVQQRGEFAAGDLRQTEQAFADQDPVFAVSRERMRVVAARGHRSQRQIEGVVAIELLPVIAPIVVQDGQRPGILKRAPARRVATAGEIEFDEIQIGVGLEKFVFAGQIVRVPLLKSLDAFAVTIEAADQFSRMNAGGKISFPLEMSHDLANGGGPAGGIRHGVQACSIGSMKGTRLTPSSDNGPPWRFRNRFPNHARRWS